MRILKVVQAYYPFQEMGGPVVKVRALARGLTKRGHSVTVLAVDLGLAGRKFPGLTFKWCEWGWRSEEDGVTALYLPTLLRFRAITVNPRVIRFSRGLRAQFDVVHVYGLYDLLGPAIGSSCRSRSVPYVVEPMGMFRPIVRSVWLKRLYHRTLGQPFIRGARFLVATSEQERQELLQGGIDAERIVVRRNGVEGPEKMPERGELRRRWGVPEQARMVLFLGRLVSKKSPDLLIEAFADWRKTSMRAADSVLVLAGPDEGDGYSAGLRAKANELGLKDSVRFVGPLYDDAKWQAYRDADVFVLPSRNENFGNTAAEAAACGTPVIVTDSCGVASFVKGAGRVVSHSRAGLARGLTELLDDPDLRQRYANGCKEMVGALSWNGPVAEAEELYERCVNGAEVDSTRQIVVE